MMITQLTLAANVANSYTVSDLYKQVTFQAREDNPVKYSISGADGITAGAYITLKAGSAHTIQVSRTQTLTFLCAADEVIEILTSGVANA